MLFFKTKIFEWACRRYIPEIVSVLENIFLRLNEIECKINELKEDMITKKEGREVMDLIQKLIDDANALVASNKTLSDRVTVAIDLIKELAAKVGTVDPRVNDVLTALEGDKAAVDASADALKAATDAVQVSGGVVTPPSA